MTDDKSVEIAKQLKPCPFCGKRAMLKYADNVPLLERFGWKRPVYMVGCTGKDCILYMNKARKRASLFWGDANPESIVERWNRRAE